MILNENMPVLKGEINRIPMVDATLTKTGWAADAKEVGEQLRKISGAGELSANAIAKATAAESAATEAKAIATAAQATAASAATVEYVDSKHKSFTGKFLASGWTDKGTYFEQVISVDGILSTDAPIVDLYGVGNGASAKQVMNEEWGKVYQILNSAGALTAYATDRPEVDLPIKVMVVR